MAILKINTEFIHVVVSVGINISFPLNKRMVPLPNLSYNADFIYVGYIF